MKVAAQSVEFGLARPFRISRGLKTTAQVIEVEVSDGTHVGRGEGVPYRRYGDSVQAAVVQAAGLAENFSRLDLLTILPPGSARNAVDLALWELECAQKGLTIWEATGITSPKPLSLGYTVSLSNAKEMIQDAKRHSSNSLLKVKLGGDDDRAALLGIREAAPSASLIVDVNEGWSPEELERMAPVLIECDIDLLEQPIPAELDHLLEKLDLPISICADESFAPGKRVSELSPGFNCVNVKLDKSGGLTAAMRDVEDARAAGLKVMIGCMVSSSLAIAPAFVAAQTADYWDLDGFLSLTQDRTPQMRVDSGNMTLPPGLWC